MTDQEGMLTSLHTILIEILRMFSIVCGFLALPQATDKLSLMGAWNTCSVRHATYTKWQKSIGGRYHGSANTAFFWGAVLSPMLFLRSCD